MSALQVEARDRAVTEKKRIPPKRKRRVTFDRWKESRDYGTTKVVPSHPTGRQIPDGDVESPLHGKAHSQEWLCHG
jgi:hypothetical protein